MFCKECSHLRLTMPPFHKQWRTRSGCSFVKAPSFANTTANRLAGKLLFRLSALPVGMLILGFLFTDLDARPRRLDLHKRSQIATSPIDSPKIDLQKNAEFTDERFDFKKWHKHYSSLGSKKPSIDVEPSVAVDVIDIERFNFEKSSLAMAADKQKWPKVRDWNRVREAVVASKYRSIDITSPVGRHIQEMVDSVSLAQINRFQSVRNDPEDHTGIPTQQVAFTTEEDD